MDIKNFNPWLVFTLFFLGILGIVGLAGLLLKYFKASGEFSRKFVHVMVGTLVLLAPFLFQEPLQPALLAVIFILLNYVSLRKEALKGMHAVKRDSFGTVYFPLTFLILILVYWRRDPSILLIAMMIMTYADPLATTVGVQVKSTIRFSFWRDQKSLPGSLSMWLASTFLTIAGLVIFRPLWNLPVPGLLQLGLIGVIVGFGAALGESIATRGSDNLSAPLLAAFLLDFLLTSSTDGMLELLFWILFSAGIAWISYRMRVLTAGGAAGATLMGMIVFGVGGFQWMLPMITFFLLSSLLSKIGTEKKRSLMEVVGKGSNRDLYQVFANGGVALILVVLWYYSGEEWLYYLYLGSLAAAMADTWGTEIGAFSKRLPRNILTFKQVPPGTSGGVTVIGTLGSVLGAIILTLSGLLFRPAINGDSILLLSGVILASGFLGAVIDSILGASLQVQHSCPVCGKITEKSSHCGQGSLPIIRGIPWINNDSVNLLCTISGALITGLLLIGLT